MSNIVVAIDCITYNHEPYIRDCLDGFVMQKTNFKFVAIVHDDASTDGTATIIKEYAEKYPDIIKPILETENQYSKKDCSIQRIMSDAINATGAKYVAMCEGDDYWIDPYKLQKQVDFMEANLDIGLCYTDYNSQIDNTKKINLSLFENCNQYRPTKYEEHLLKPGYLAPMTWLYKKELLDYLKDSRIYSDGTFVYMLEFMYNSKVAYIPEVTAVYRTHQGSASRPTTSYKLYKYIKGIFDTQVYFMQKYPCEPSLKEKILMRGYLDVLPVAVKANRNDFIEEARNYFNSKSFNIDIIIRDLIEGDNRLHSNAYKLGKFLLKPLSKLRKLF